MDNNIPILGFYLEKFEEFEPIGFVLPIDRSVSEDLSDSRTGLTISEETVTKGSFIFFSFLVIPVFIHEYSSSG